MSRMGVRITILCEDNDHLRFATGVLKRVGFHPREILESRVAPRGRGAADAWVLNKFREEFDAIVRRPFQRLALITMIDADSRLVDDRVSQFQEAVRDLPG